MQEIYSNIEHLSGQLADSVRTTLDLDEKEPVFSGNEEKVFLNALLQRTIDVPDNFLFLDVQKSITYNSFIDIFNSDVAKRVSRKKDIKNKYKALLNLIKNRIWKTYALQRVKNRKILIHHAAHMRFSLNVFPNLTLLKNFEFVEKNLNLRKTFYLNLLNNSIEQELAKKIANLFPVSHLEQFKILKNSSLTNINIEVVATSVYGLMEDPVLSFIVKNNRSKLIYVQHGGNYGFNGDHIGLKAEKEGADVMVYWGVGDYNVYPTRFRNWLFFSKTREEAVLLLSKSAVEVEKYLAYSEKLKKELIALSVIAHPSNFRPNTLKLEYGIADYRHQRAKLVVYDNILHTNIYKRILMKKPFLIIDTPLNTRNVEYDNGHEFLNLLKGAQILVKPDNLTEEIQFWMKQNTNVAKLLFRDRAKKVISHILDNPKLDDFLRSLI